MAARLDIERKGKIFQEIRFIAVNYKIDYASQNLKIRLLAPRDANILVNEVLRSQQTDAGTSICWSVAVRDEWEERAGMAEFRNRARAGARRMLLLTLASIAILNLAVHGIRVLHGGL